MAHSEPDTAPSIVEFADTAARGLRAQFDGDPAGEFMSWIQIALRREAMVSEAYDARYVQAHLSRLADAGAAQEIVEVVGRAIASAWAQEEGHQAYLSGVIRSVAPPDHAVDRLRAKVQHVMGAVEGQTFANLVSPSWAARARARLALAVGQLVQEVPPFIDQLRTGDFASFCRVNADLEATAITGYRRMLELMAVLEEDPAPGSTLHWDLSRTLRDEVYHRELFSTLALLFDVSAAAPPQLTIDGVHAGIERAQRFAYEGELRTRGVRTADVPSALAARAAQVIALDPDLVGGDAVVRTLRSRMAV